VNLTRSLYGLGGWCVRHGWLVVLLWLLFLGGVNALDRFLPAPAERAFVLEGTGSAAAQTLLNRAFPGSAAQPAPLVLQREQGWDDPAGQALLADVEAGVAALDDVNAVTSPRTEDGLLSNDRSTALVLITIDERLGGDLGVAQEIQDVAGQVAGDQADVALGGYLGSVISQPDTKRSEAIGLALAAVVLLVTLRRGWPVLVPFVTAIAAVGSGLAIVGLLERVTFIPDEATILGTMLGLGVGIDYALFLVTRHRMLLQRGFDVPESAARTAGTAGAAMVFAGGTLIAAVSGLVLTGISFLAWLGFAAAVIVAIAVAAALTLVPALLGILGERVLPRRWQGERTDAELDTGRWARIADAVTRRPWTSAILATSVLLALAAPTLAMTFGQNDGRAFPPDSPAYQSTVLIEDGFGPGRNGPLVVAAQLYTTAVIPDGLDVAAVQGDPRAEDPRLVAVGDALAADPGVASVTAPVVSTDGGVAVWQVIPTTGPADPATQQLVERLRADLLPQVTDGQAMAAYVGGVTAARSDLSLKVQERLEPFVLGVVLLSFLLIMVAYRSLVIPLKAAVMNLLSIAAAYGVVVMIFQFGWGASAIGLDGPVPIESFVPMMMFAVLFGLSMDYEVFLLTSFREHWERTGDVAVAVRRALADTGQVITSAALIMVGVFASFVLAEQAIAKMFGIGLATAVALDATLVRCVLVPSIMVLAAKGTFWLPGWLDRLLPHVHVEGDPAAVGLGRAPRAEPLPDPTAPAARLTAVVVAVAVAWFVGTRLDGSGSGAPFADVAVAVCVVGGAVAAWLPRGLVGAGSHLSLRLLALVGGGLTTALSYAVGQALVPPVQADAGRLAGAALLACAAVAVLPGVRRYGLAVLLGGAGVAVTVGVAGAAAAAGVGGAVGGQVGSAVLPAVLAFLLVRVVDAVLAPASAAAPLPAVVVGAGPTPGGADRAVLEDMAAADGVREDDGPREGAPGPREGAAEPLAPVALLGDAPREEAVSR
jgi:RND superfamily putative drug exporter